SVAANASDASSFNDERVTNMLAFFNKINATLFVFLPFIFDFAAMASRAKRTRGVAAAFTVALHWQQTRLALHGIAYKCSK
ncbi:unnamed protein product, partial [Ceratitis capitata]